MSLYADNGERFPDGAAVMVRFPLSGTPADAGRADWPWVAGHVVERCGPDEWLIVVDGPPELAEAPPDDPDGDPLFPLCFRDASELR
jgi:hypothetical protein